MPAQNREKLTPSLLVRVHCRHKSNDFCTKSADVHIWRTPLSALNKPPWLQTSYGRPLT